MAKKNRQGTARSTFREKRLNGSAQYIPSVSVERPIVWPDCDEEQAYITGSYKAFGKSLPKGKSAQHRIVRPREMHIVQVRHEAVADQVLAISTDTRKVKAVKKLAYLMQEALGQSLKDAPTQMSINLGRISCRPEPTCTWLAPEEQLVLGVELQGWRGMKANYSQDDAKEVWNPLFQLAQDAKALSEAIESTGQGFKPRNLIADPYFAVVQNRTGSLRRDATRLVPGLCKENVLPATLLLGDPILTLRLGPLPEQQRQIPLRYDEQDFQAA